MHDLIDENELEREKRNRLRGWTLYLIYAMTPRSTDFATLKSLLDRRNFPLSAAGLVKVLTFLCSEDLVEVSHISNKYPKTDQDALLTRYQESHNADDAYCVKLCRKGREFQEENIEIKGITRIG